MTEHWSTTGRLRWVVRYPEGHAPTTLVTVVAMRVLQQEWAWDGWDPSTEWRDVPVEQEPE
jgi:hypothetical protein